MSETAHVCNGHPVQGELLRILNIVGAFPPAFAEGGPGIMTYNVSRELIRLGHQVFVLTTDKCLNERMNVPRGDTQWEGVPVRYCRWQPSILLYHSPELRSQVKARVAHTDVALISSSWTSYGVAAGAECRRAGVPYALYTHGGYDPVRLRRSWLKKKLWWYMFDRMLYQHASAVITMSRRETCYTRAMGIDRPVVEIPIGVNTDHLRVRAPRDELDIRFPMMGGRRILLFLGRVHPIKGIDVLVQAFARTRAVVPDALLVIAGAGERRYMDQVSRWITQDGLEKDAILTGPVSVEDKAGLFYEAEVFCLTSYTEGLPAAALEAMYCHTPVILSEACNLPEVREAGAGFITSLNPDEIAARIVDLLRNNAARQQMGANGARLVAERFTWDRVAQQTAELCREIVRCQASE